MGSFAKPSLKIIFYSITRLYGWKVQVNERFKKLVKVTKIIVWGYDCRLKILTYLMENY